MRKAKIPTYMRTQLGKCVSCGKMGVAQIYDEELKRHKVMCKYCKWIHLPKDMDLASSFKSAAKLREEGF